MDGYRPGRLHQAVQRSSGQRCWFVDIAVLTIAGAISEDTDWQAGGLFARGSPRFAIAQVASEVFEPLTRQPARIFEWIIR